MKKNVSIMIAGLIVGAIIVGAGGFWVFNSMRSSNPQTQTSHPADLPAATEQTPSPSQATTVNVAIKNRAFSLKTVTVKKGTTVVWTNEDPVGHNVVSDSDSPAGGPPSSAPLLAKGETFTFTFDTPGTFTYHCAPHPDMTGTVEVVE